MIDRKITGTTAASAFASVLCFAALTSGQTASERVQDRLAVHEWGTFTSLQDENGNAIGGINADDEPVPKFVHRIADFLVIGPNDVPALAQGAPHCHPDVTMRLETPIIYFHPAPGQKLPVTVNLEVAFNAGWLSEYYPAAKVEAPGVKGQMSFGPLTANTIGQLLWKDLQVGTKESGPKTDSHVWLAPRSVKSANVTTTDGESEEYLFYRGVGNVDSPLNVSRDKADQSLIIKADFADMGQPKPVSYVVPAMWLVEIRDDKSCAFRQLDGFQVAGGDRPSVVANTPGRFEKSEFNPDNFGKLAADMKSALVDDGLFADEADALLGTWNLSYFQTPGLRLFYLVPREWTDQVLPMKLSLDAGIVRTMVGRIEVVTPLQRQLLSRIAAGPASTAEWMREGRERLRLNPSAEARAMPDDYAAYQRLGRFRNALLLDELNRRPTPALKTFVDGYGLRGFTPSDLASASAPAKE